MVFSNADTLATPSFDDSDEARGAAQWVPCHSLDVAAVGVAAVRQHPAQLRWLRERLGGVSEQALCDWLAFWLALHGVGLACWRAVVLPVAIEQAWFGDDADVIDGIDCWARAVMGQHGEPTRDDAPDDGAHCRHQDPAAVLAFCDAVRKMFLDPSAAAVATTLGAETFEQRSRALTGWLTDLAALASGLAARPGAFVADGAAPAALADHWPTALRRADAALDAPAPLQTWAETVPLHEGPQIHLLEDDTGAHNTQAAMTLARRLQAQAGCDLQHAEAGDARCGLHAAAGAPQVLVVEAVHACEARLQRTLASQLQAHAQAGGSAVLVTSALPSRMKTALLAAFAHGRGHRVPAVAHEHYPLATSWSPSMPMPVETPIAARPEQCRAVQVRYGSDRAAVLQAIVQAVRAGQRVAWVCNTGDAAQQARSALAAWAPDSTAALRAGQLRILTPGDEPALGSGVDLLVSDLAPVDRLLQRAGHLCRAVRAHHGAWLDGWGEPSMWVLGPAWAGQSPAAWIEAALPETAMRYPHHGQLWRTAQALQAERWQLPHEVRALIETVFNGDEDLPDGVHLHARQREGSR